MVLLLRRVVALPLLVVLLLVGLPVLVLALLLALLGFLGQVLVQGLELALQGLQVLAQVPPREQVLPLREE
jgi:hypothetical protein